VQPKRGDIHRRILLDHNVVVSLVFNPDNPKILPPEIKFTGPEKTIQELELLLDQNCKVRQPILFSNPYTNTNVIFRYSYSVLN
jgi:hypothetical protein